MSRVAFPRLAGIIECVGRTTRRLTGDWTMTELKWKIELTIWRLTGCWIDQVMWDIRFKLFNR